ncbi:alpha/beta hydrolase family protein [Rhodococcus erythropolis]|uniref:alpha/beta hydrolase n=1 Tax=Rhodococcus TaxID=1827 RepID=UPI00294A410E|nr:alpha/beta hydrolase family protein [Rhodococcus erythropolis]MDV6273349.1 alpha/beta hydrolase family protein [Rhodococcus erythropolis]
MKTRRFTVRLTMAVAMAAGFLGLSAPTASADSVVSRIDVYSPSMDRWIANDVISPAGGGAAPTFYLLTGVGGGEDGISWFNNTGVRDFFNDKHVNVVMPVGGKFSMYTDWNADDPVLGRNKWQTYLTKELPAAVNARYNTTGVNALGGVSMAGGPVLDLAIQSPGTYRAVGSYSGCPRAGDPLGQAAVRSMVEILGGGNAGNMWGPWGSPQWAAHDPLINAEKLRGTALFISTGNGLPGPVDGINSLAMAAGVVPGAVLEGITNMCTAALQGRFGQLGIPATFSFRPEGTHTWGLFEADMRASWPMIAGAIGA